MNRLSLLDLRLGADALARKAAMAFAENRPDDALPPALAFAGKAGAHYPEAFALCAMILSKMEQWPSALEFWDKALLNCSWRLEWLEQALRDAWRIEKILPKAAHFAGKWTSLLENIFIKPPSPAILSRMRQNGWTGKGCVGIHLNHLRGWLWLDKEEKPAFKNLFCNVINLSLSLRSIYEDETHKLLELDSQLPDAEKLSILGVFDGKNAHVRGSPIAISPALSVLEKSGKPKKGQGCKAHATILIPFYGDRHSALACLASLLASLKKNRAKCEILAVWDHGPDKQLLADLQRLAAGKKIALLEAPMNMGFLAAVNYGISHIPAGDIILLNSDTLVHGSWIDRLLQAAAKPDAATVTALGSDAELLSFPSPENRAEAPGPKLTAMIDEACAALPPEAALHEIPIGVGFCMLLTRRALRSIGGLDGLRLFKGYGEEVDFCLRAKAAGLKNYAALNVFVAHAGGKSFGAAKKALAGQNNKAIYALYPPYKTNYENFMVEDPLHGARERISRKLCAHLDPVPTIALLPWHCQFMPPWSRELARENNMIPQGAALFAMPLAGGWKTMLQVEAKIPLENMKFRLPADLDCLREVLSLMGANAAIIHYDNKILDKLAMELGLRRIASGLEGPSSLPRLKTIPPGAYFAPPPATMAGWKILRMAADKYSEAIFHVPRLRKAWPGVPLPTNVLPMPPLDDLRPLGAKMIIFSESMENPNHWRQWFAKRFCGMLDMALMENA